jgi:hypothetical protein
MFLTVEFVEKLHDMKSAFVEVKVDVAPVEVGGAGLPERGIGIMFLDGLPRRTPYMLIEKVFENEKQIKRIFPPGFAPDDRPSCGKIVCDNEKGFRFRVLQSLIHLVFRRDRRRLKVAEAVKNAASGYGAVVLGVVCFLLTLVVIMGIVRFIVGLGTGTGV